MDCTVGMGGHAEAVLEASSPHGRLVGLDSDPEALELASQRLQPYGERVRLIHSNFAQLDRHVTGPMDGVLMDLGVSSYQLDTGRRGFSFTHDGPLDMRMDPTSGPSAEDVIHALSKAELAAVIREFGEERWANRIAHAIVRRRKEGRIRSSVELADLVRSAVPKPSRIHPATRTFQAIRIYVNRELENLAIGLEKALQVLKPGGRLCVISFHSLEDRLVKHTFREWASSCICPPKTPICVCQHEPSVKLVVRRPIVPDKDETARNPRARSSKLRVAESLSRCNWGENEVSGRFDEPQTPP